MKIILLQMNILPLFSVVYIGFDGDSDVWPSTNACFSKNWLDADIPAFFCSINLANKPSPFQTFTCKGDNNYSTRVRYALSQIKTPYVLVLLHDFILTKPVTTEDVFAWTSVLKKTNCDYLQIGSHFERKARGGKVPGESSFRSIPSDRHYRVCLQPAIWKKSFLLDLCTNNDFQMPQNLEIYLDDNPSGRKISSKASAFLMIKHQISVGNMIESKMISYPCASYLETNHFPISKSRNIQPKKAYKKAHRLDQARQDCPYWIIRVYKKIGRLFGKKYFTK